MLSLLLDFYRIFSCFPRQGASFGGFRPVARGDGGGAAERRLREEAAFGGVPGFLRVRVERDIDRLFAILPLQADFAGADAFSHQLTSSENGSVTPLIPCSMPGTR